MPCLSTLYLTEKKNDHISRKAAMCMGEKKMQYGLATTSNA